MKRKICIDAGHGGHDSGALGPNGLKEKDVALAVAMMLAANLESNFQVLLSRRDDTFLTLSDRARRANDWGADALISIHCNAGGGSGFEVFTTPETTPSDALATDLFAAYGAAFPTKPKRADLSDGDPDKEANFAVLRLTHMRAALFELEFIDTAEGERFLGDHANQGTMAKALCAGVMKHFGMIPVREDPAAILKDALRAKAREISLLIDQLP